MLFGTIIHGYGSKSPLPHKKQPLKGQPKHPTGHWKHNPSRASNKRQKFADFTLFALLAIILDVSPIQLKTCLYLNKHRLEPKHLLPKVDDRAFFLPHLFLPKCINAPQRECHARKKVFKRAYCDHKSGLDIAFPLAVKKNIDTSVTQTLSTRKRQIGLTLTHSNKGTYSCDYIGLMHFYRSSNFWPIFFGRQGRQSCIFIMHKVHN